MEPKAKFDTPEFSSLTDIMQRFNEIPYEQFQRELHESFDRNFSGSQADLPPARRETMLNFKKQIMQLADDLFKQAEMVQQCRDMIK